MGSNFNFNTYFLSVHAEKILQRITIWYFSSFRNASLNTKSTDRLETWEFTIQKIFLVNFISTGLSVYSLYIEFQNPKSEFTPPPPTKIDAIYKLQGGYFWNRSWNEITYYYNQAKSHRTEENLLKLFSNRSALSKITIQSSDLDR